MTDTLIPFPRQDREEQNDLADTVKAATEPLIADIREALIEKRHAGKPTGHAERLLIQFRDTAALLRGALADMERGFDGSESI